MLCRHCQKWVATRPRGLCWVCYYAPGVRELYPAQSRASVIVDRFGKFPPPAFPTRARPGTPEKIAVLHARALARCQLWHPDDAPADDESHALGMR